MFIKGIIYMWRKIWLVDRIWISEINYLIENDWNAFEVK